jgi:D-alanyl-D-alanine carboxypeptidase/D-alanyl-D-alanine-endopeptidase (penicillin-binding protein 4)
MTKLAFLSIKIISVIALLPFFEPIYAQSFKPSFNTFLSDPVLHHATVSCALVDVASGEVVFEHEGQKTVLPASSQKLFTTLAALEHWGEEHRFRTQVWSADGSVYLDTGGDPTFGSDRFWESKSEIEEIIRKLKESGITAIDTFFVRNEVFSDMPFAGTVPVEDVGNYYGGGIPSFSFQENIYKLHLQSSSQVGGEVTVLRTEPELPFLEFDCQVKSSNNNRDNAYIYSFPGSKTALISGTIPAGRSDFEIKGYMPNPVAVFGEAFMEAAKKAGISVKAVKSIPFGNRSFDEPLFVLESPKLADIVAEIHDHSLNPYTDFLFKRLGEEMVGDASFSGGQIAVKGFWNGRGVDMNGVRLADGSGLSRANGITTVALAQVLSWFAGNHPGKTLGELKPFGKFARAKSGYMEGVRSYAGVATHNGRQVSFSIVVNNYDCSPTAMRLKMEKLFDGWFGGR